MNIKSTRDAKCKKCFSLAFAELGERSVEPGAGSARKGARRPARSAGHDIQNCAEGSCLSCSTRICRSLNFQKPFPLKKQVLPVNKQTLLNRYLFFKSFNTCFGKHLLLGVSYHLSIGIHYQYCNRLLSTLPYREGSPAQRAQLLHRICTKTRE